ncbi:hypothetical protein SJS40_07200 [Aeromonas caviae]|uniref:DUF4376 domain-containing protein n=1 Tax=Aeromonas caviae TaxID=648 RepID=UPI0029D6DFAD|nr:hypothetical protein [Aeromonas caviae]MDX7753347.1 hypothetical protein [Aeromonas caviae]MDX7774097.1 hypothetical protein [Aeromonas caviae]
MIDWDAVVTVSEKSRQEFEQDYAIWKQERAALVGAITVQVGDHLYQGDELSQSRMARFIAASTSDSDEVEWTLADNTVATVTISTLRDALRLAGVRQTEIWNDGRPSSITC